MDLNVGPESFGIHWLRELLINWFLQIILGIKDIDGLPHGQSGRVPRAPEPIGALEIIRLISNV